MTTAQSLSVERFVICGDDESTHYPEEHADLECGITLLEKLRDQHPDVAFSLFAEVAA